MRLLVETYRKTDSYDRVIGAFPQLKPDEVRYAPDWYILHPARVDEDIARNEAALRELQRRAGLGIRVYTDAMITPKLAVEMQQRGYDVESCQAAGRHPSGSATTIRSPTPRRRAARSTPSTSLTSRPKIRSGRPPAGRITASLSRTTSTRTSWRWSGG